MPVPCALLPSAGLIYTMQDNGYIILFSLQSVSFCHQTNVAKTLYI